MAYSEYKIIHVVDGLLLIIYLGAIQVPIKKTEAALNQIAAK